MREGHLRQPVKILEQGLQTCELRWTRLLQVITQASQLREGVARQRAVGGTRGKQVRHAVAEALQPGQRQGGPAAISQGHERRPVLPGAQNRRCTHPVRGRAARRPWTGGLKPQVKGTRIKLQPRFQRRSEHERFMAFTPDLPLPRFEFGREAHGVSRSELGAVAWHQPQCIPEVLYEVALSHFIPSRNRPTQVHQAPSIDTSSRRLPVDQSREDR
jgi:hypothetical protein